MPTLLSSLSIIALLLLYVDDLVIIGNDQGYISYLIQQLSLLFEMKHLVIYIISLASKCTEGPKVCFYLKQSMLVISLLVFLCLAVNHVPLLTTIRSNSVLINQYH